MEQILRPWSQHKYHFDAGSEGGNIYPRLKQDLSRCVSTLLSVLVFPLSVCATLSSRCDSTRDLWCVRFQLSGQRATRDPRGRVVHSAGKVGVTRGALWVLVALLFCACFSAGVHTRFNGGPLTSSTNRLCQILHRNWWGHVLHGLSLDLDSNMVVLLMAMKNCVCVCVCVCVCWGCHPGNSVCVCVCVCVLGKSSREQVHSRKSTTSLFHEFDTFL